MLCPKLFKFYTYIIVNLTGISLYFDDSLTKRHCYNKKKKKEKKDKEKQERNKVCMCVCMCAAENEIDVILIAESERTNKKCNIEGDLNFFLFILIIK